MSKESSKKESHQRCTACDFQKLKQLENNPVLRNRRDKIEQLNFRLTECKNENQMLKRNLQLAKKMVYQEVGVEEVDFQSLMKHGTESGSKGRQEDILVLKKRVQELKNYLKELEGGDPPTPQETPSQEYVKHQMPNDRKKLWRMELERRLARENAEKDINPLVQECSDLRKNLDAEKNQFQRLNQEVKLLKAELQNQVEKNEEEMGILNSFKTLEKQLKDTMQERADIRQNLSGTRARNKSLTEELTSLEEELQNLQMKTNANNALIDSLISSHKSIQEAIDAEKMLVQQNADRYKEELKLLQDNYATDCDILDHLQCIIYDRNTLIDTLGKDANSTWTKESEREENTSNNLKKLSNIKLTELQQSFSKNNTNEVAANSAIEEECPNENQPDSSESKICKLRLECAKYKALCEASKMESDHLSQLVEIQDNKLNDASVQVIETGRLIMQRNAEKKELIEKINKLQRCLSARHKKGKLRVQPNVRLEELKIKTDAQKAENEYLRNFLRSSVCGRAKDLQDIIGFIADSEHFFKACLDEIKELVESKTPPGITESVNELDGEN